VFLWKENNQLEDNIEVIKNNDFILLNLNQFLTDGADELKLLLASYVKLLDYYCLLIDIAPNFLVKVLNLLSKH